MSRKVTGDIQLKISYQMLQIQLSGLSLLSFYILNIFNILYPGPGKFIACQDAV